MGWNAEDAQAAADSMTPEEVDAALAEWEEYEADRDADEEGDNGEV